MKEGFVKRMELKLDQYKMYIDGQFVESSEGTARQLMTSLLLD